MKLCKKNFICVIIFIVALFAGVCFENIKTDAFNLHSSSDHFVSSVSYESQTFRDTEPCTTVRMLAQRGAGVHKNMQNHVRRTIYKVFSQMLCTSQFSLSGVNQIDDPHQNPASRILSKEIMTNYIHQSDGKKRI